MGNIAAQSGRYARGADWYLVETAWGWCGLRRSANGICRLTPPSPDLGSALLSDTDTSAEALHDPLLEMAAEMLVSYFDGDVVCFDLPVAPEGMTEFGLRVLRACAEIPWGATRSYGEIAEAIGAPRAARAVGQALARNPVPIIIPCHRVIGSDGRLVGFGPGVGMKKRLLELEEESIMTRSGAAVDAASSVPAVR